MVRGWGSEDVRVVLLKWDILRPKDHSAEVTSYGLCGTRSTWRIYWIIRIIAGLGEQSRSGQARWEFVDGLTVKSRFF
jgi:hypothetical protein